ncbi:protein phosphatase 1 regulatory subunit 12A isoform X2 [Silurus meridionalis]|uniref:protein phosphatase 1 regulatory subunit 12A isoform X2 n=1 Tax=Silurus meridionalis TaxID=175797 RepID=UPI001EEA5CAF|nr:protein phosphatase 1 regulatory subunit 12A isoform X2 [Silurus meridionalis]
MHSDKKVALNAGQFRHRQESGNNSSVLEMSSYMRNKDQSSRTRKFILDLPSLASSANKSIRQDRLSRGDASEVESTLETLSQTTYSPNKELDSLNKTTDSATKDYKKLYAEALAENKKLKACLVESKQDLARLRLQLDKVTQVLEKRVSKMEEELK